VEKSTDAANNENDDERESENNNIGQIEPQNAEENSLQILYE